MKNEKVLFAQTVRFIIVHSGPIRADSTVYNLVRGVEARYKFLEAPRELSQFDFTKGVTFRSGLFHDQIIDRLQLYNNGILSESSSSTSLCDEFLDDLVSWMNAELTIRLEENNETARIYNSEIEFVNTVNRNDGTESLISDRLAAKVAQYGPGPGVFITSGFMFQPNLNDQSMASIYKFTLERRVGRPLGDNCYFSKAPLKTEDHVNLIREIEEMIMSNPSPTNSSPPSERSPRGARN